METEIGLKGESPRAISSAFTNSFTPRIPGNIEKEAVVFPAQLGPAIMNNWVIVKIQRYSFKVRQSFHVK